MLTFACQDIEFKDLLRCSFGLSKAEYNVMMFMLVSSMEYTAEKLAKEMDLDRTTVQKAIKKLAEKELVTRHQSNLEAGGYTFFYKIHNKENIKERMKATVEKWHEAVVNEIQKW